ncbi:MAG TPA: TonB family protein [Longimicrobium sp.]
MADPAPVLELPPGLAARVLRRRSSGELIVFDTTREIGAGGEARVLEVPGDWALVAKLYREPTMARARKLGLMLSDPPVLDAGAAVAWPVDLLTGPSGGRFAGFLMPRAEGPRLFEFYNPVSRRRTAPLFDYALLHRAGVNLAAAFHGLHAHGYVVGDVNESNILVNPTTAAVTLVDADSFQVRDGGGRSIHRSGVGKAEFTPPELQGAHFSEVDRGEEHDRFGLAALLFLLLMEGTHPFACRLGDGAEVPPVEERISRGMFPYAGGDEGVRPPRLAPPFFALDPALQAMFARAFVAGHGDPSARPAPAEWREALAEAEARLAVCAANPRHRHAPELEFCPWCHRTRLLQGRDPFPATVELARVHDTAPVPRRAQFASAPPFAPQAAAPAPFQPSPPPQPSAAGQWVRTRSAAAVAAMPAWMQPAFGPAALGSPLVWMPPAALTCLFGASGGGRMLGLIVFFLALRRVFSGGLNLQRLRLGTVAWAVILLVVWSFVAAMTRGGPSYADGSRPTFADRFDIPDAPDAPDAWGPPSAVMPEPTVQLAYPDASVTVSPELVNAREIAGLAATYYPPELRNLRLIANVDVRILVERDGTPNSTGLYVVRSTDPRFDEAALRAAAAMRFNPAQQADGNTVPTWVQATLYFVP